jgi:aspartyl aminopeptidase
VMRETENGVRAELVNIERDSLIIPSLAIHMSSDANKGHEYNIQRELAPLYGMSDSKEGFGKEIGENLGYDMYLYNRMKGTIWGKDEEFLSAPRLDDLECAFCITEAFIEEDRTKEEQSDMIRLMAVFDNEEVGSSTFQGAKSDFLSETLERINEALGFEKSQLMRAKANSLMISADNAHAVHPNYTDKACPSNRPVINGGIVIKHNANRRYTTDAVSEALFRKICDRGKIPYQFFTNRSDMPGGSTLGNLSNEKVSFNTIDIGLAQLAMHSAYETAGTKDVGYLYEAMRLFFKTQIEASDNEFLIKE